MTVNEPVALPLCSLTVVRELIKWEGTGALLRTITGKADFRLAAADPSVVAHRPGPLGVCLCIFMHSGWGARSLYNVRPGPVKPTSKSSIRRKDVLRKMLYMEQLLQPSQQHLLGSFSTTKLLISSHLGYWPWALGFPRPTQT